MLFQRHIQENTKKKRHTDHIEHLKKNENFKQNWDQRTAPFKTQVNQKKSLQKKKTVSVVCKTQRVDTKKKGGKRDAKGKEKC